MNNKRNNTITIRVCKETLDHIDKAINKSNIHRTRSDYIRDLIKKCDPEGKENSDFFMKIHPKMFQKMLSFLDEKGLKKLANTTSEVIHSTMQHKKKSSIDKIKIEEAISYIKDIYESRGIVEEFFHKNDAGEYTVCLSGENLQNKIFCNFIKEEINHVMFPWVSIKSVSKKPGNMVIVFS